MPVDDIFWNEESQKLYEILFPLISSASLSGARNAYDALGGVAELGVAWDVVNDDVIKWATAHTIEVVAQVTKTSMAAFVEHFDSWLLSGETMDSLIELLTPYYGVVRAEMIAVTETTRAFALGNLEAWKSSGVVSGWKWRTAMDDIVCPICTEKERNNPYEFGDETPPAHVRCRCSMSPVMKK